MLGLFEVTVEHIGRLSDIDLRTLVGYLAERECAKANLSPSAVTYGGSQDAADGGVDVRVCLEQEISGYIPRRQTIFQTKATPMPQKKILGEMRPGGRLRETIRDLASSGGAYIIVSSKASVSDSALQNRRSEMRQALADISDAESLYVDFYDQQRIASWSNQHPGIIPWVRSRSGLPLQGWRAYEDWSSSPGGNYITANKAHILVARPRDGSHLSTIATINELRAILGRPEGSARLTGLSGVGKTRLAVALFDESVGTNPLDKSLAVYCDLSNDPVPSPLDLLGHLNQSNRRCVLVIDNCGAELHSRMASAIKRLGGPVSIISIEYDVGEDCIENTESFSMEPCSDELIQETLAHRFTNLSGPEIQKISEFAEGNFRIAIALGEMARKGESLASLQDRALVRRLLHQNRPENDALIRVAKACSLVCSFDVETLEGPAAELPYIATLAGQSDSDVCAHIGELGRRHIIQKRSKWRALLPQALAQKLATEALQDIPSQFLKVLTSASTPGRLRRSFSRRLGCMHESPKACTIAIDWIGDALERVESLDHTGITILTNLAPASPETVLNVIEKTGSRIPNFYCAENAHRREIIALLRCLAYDADLFDRAAYQIASFAMKLFDTHNANEAVYVFKSLFQIYLSGTQATPTQRANLITRVAASNSLNAPLLVETALDSFLSCHGFNSCYGFGFGARRRTYGHEPRDQDEINNWYAIAFSLTARLATIPEHRKIVRETLARHVWLLTEAGFTDELIDLAKTLVHDGGWPEGWAPCRGAARRNKKAGRNSDAKKLDSLASFLAPKSLRECISAYVLKKHWSLLFELGDAQVRRHKTASRAIERECVRIGTCLAKNREDLLEHLPELLKSQTSQAVSIARAIGRSSSPFDVWSIIKQQTLSFPVDSRSFRFAANFLSGLSEQDRGLAEKLLDEAVESVELHPGLVLMQTMVGLDRTGSDRLIRACSLDSVPTNSFSNLWIVAMNDETSDYELARTLRRLAERQDGAGIAMSVLGDCLEGRTLKKETLLELGRHLFSIMSFNRQGRHDDYKLARVADVCLRPSDILLATGLCERIADAIDCWTASLDDYLELIATLGEHFPRAALAAFVERDGEKGRLRSFDFDTNRPCPFRKIDQDEMLEWARERPEVRFGQLANALRPWDSAVSRDSNKAASPLRWTELGLRIIHEAPDPFEVLSKFAGGFMPSSWSGSLADTLERRLPLLEELLSDPAPGVVDAVVKVSIEYRSAIDRARRRESEEHKERDQRFEW